MVTSALTGLPLHPQLRTALASWLTERTDWPKADENPALFLNQLGDRLGVRGARTGRSVGIEETAVNRPIIAALKQSRASPV